MDEADSKQSTGEKDEERDGKKVRSQRQRSRKGSSGSPNYRDKSEKRAQRRQELVEDGSISTYEITDNHYSNNENGRKEKRTDSNEREGSKQKEKHSKKQTSTVKKKSSKTSNNDKDIQAPPGSRDEDENNVGGKQKNGKQGEKKNRPKSKYYEGETARQKSQKHPWDFMMDKRDDERTEVHSVHYWNTLQVITKIVVCIFISTFVLATAVISKLCLILITSNILPPMNDTDLYWWHKTAGFSLTFSNQETNVQWIWALLLIISAPYIFTIMASVWQLFLGRGQWKSSWTGFLRIMMQEILHSIGLCMMAFIPLPSVDPVAGILVCFHVATIPGILGIFQPFFDQLPPRLSRVLHTIVLLLQLAGIGFACGYYIRETKTEDRILQKITICLSPIFISIYWWENYFTFTRENTGKETERKTQNYTLETGTNTQSDAKKKVYFLECLRDLLAFRSKRTVKFDILVNFGKVITTLLFAVFLFGPPCECTHTLFGLYPNSTFANGVGKSVLSSRTSYEYCKKNLPLIVAAVGIICSGASYTAVKIGYKIVAHIPCVSIPLTCSSPIALAALFWILNRDIESCALLYPLMRKNPPTLLNHLRSSNYWMVIVSGLCGYISLTIISSHIWRLDKGRLIKSKELFGKPLYCGILFDQSIPLNIIRTATTRKEDGEIDGSCKKDTSLKISHEKPKVYICATMWHETKSEMTKLIQSILRLGEDRKKISTMKKKMGFFNEDFFNFEVHIFFDDAFVTQKDDNGQEEIVLNRYVKDLIEVVLEVTGNKTLPESKCSTKYGGRLQWNLPHKSAMFAHLKNKNLVRRKKRWSQVMYMYYFLGYQFLEEIKQVVPGVKNIDDILSTISSHKAMQERIKNTFILALDGDVDFQPEAVKYLMDRMRKQPMVGAACGRIHPTGSGPVVWYQKFEYAVSHWLQKAAEDMLGCVLCSPGCFSLFRGSALIDSNVMKVYTRSSAESLHHVQYDLGEDRWLCTLLLKQGYKVEYVAASDAFTQAPEGFNEFFNQRRRWCPSTMANILDLILDWKHVVNINTHISRMYIFYQAFLMFCTVLTPGAILLMIVGAVTMAFPALPLWVALLFTTLPVAAFIGICFNARTETQLKFAVILSIAYALVMMIVLVGLVIHIVQNGLCSITTIFLIYVAGVFLIAALLHPKEFFCVLHGFLYFIAIPCTSLIMMLYALCNLNITSWGTRENTQQQDTNQGIPHNRREKFDSSYGTGSIFRCLFFSQESNQQFLADRLDTIERQPASYTKEKAEEQEKSRSKETAIKSDNALQTTYEIEGRAAETSNTDKNREEPNTQMMNSVSNQKDYLEEKDEKDKKPINDAIQEIVEPFTNRAWLNDRLLLDTKYKGLTRTEKEFWMQMVRRYIFPADQTDEEKEQMEHELTILRNKVCLFFILANALFICIVFSLQQITTESRSLSVPLPCITGENRLNYVEPISFAFTFIFGIILLVQFLCMLLHRFGTLIHICSRTEIFKKTNDNRNMWKLYMDINRAVRIKQKHEFLRSIFQPTAVHPMSESESGREKTTQGRWKDAGEAVIAQQRHKKDNAMNMFREQIKLLTNFVREQKDKRSKGGDMQEEIRMIRERFPNFTKEAHLAIHILCGRDDASKSQSSGTVIGNAQNGAGRISSESTEQ